MSFLATSSLVTFIRRWLGIADQSRNETSEPQSVSQSGYDPLDLIHSALLAHDIPSRRGEQDVWLTGHDLRFQAAVFDKHRSDPGHQIVLEIYIYSPRMSVQPIAEAFSGLGETRDAAIANAFEKFLRCTFHVVIEGLADHVCNHMQANVQHWRGLEAGWKVYAGPVFCYGAGPNTLSEGFWNFLDELEQLFSTAVTPASHFVRIYIASIDGAVAGREVLLDNETWPEGEALLDRQDWQCDNDFQSLREVLIALPALKVST